MTFVKIDSKKSEVTAIRRYALLKSYVRDRDRSEKLNEFKIHEQITPTTSSSPPPRNKVVGGGSISTDDASTSGNKKKGKKQYALSDVASVPSSSEKRRKKVKTSGASRRHNDTLGGGGGGPAFPAATLPPPAASSHSVDVATKKRTIQQKTREGKKSPQNVAVENKRHLYTTLQPKFLSSSSSSNASPRGTRRRRRENRGSGLVQFLPGDVKSLRKQLGYLIAEYKAGNRSLKNKIAAILKNLHDRKVMTKREYDTEINSIFG